MAGSDTMMMLVGGVVLIGGAFLFKDEIMGFINEMKSGGVPEEPMPVEPEGDGTGEGEGEADQELSSRTIVIDYYAGRVAQSVTKISTRNIYNWQEIKNVIIEKYVADVTAIAEFNKFEQKPIDENNMGSMRAYAKLVLKVAQQMGISIRPEEKKALEEVAGVGVTPVIPKSTQERRRYIVVTKTIINVTPPVIIHQVNPVVYYKVREYQIKRGWKPKGGSSRGKRVVFRDWKELDKWYIIRYGHARPTPTTLPPGCTLNSTTGIITCVQSALAYAFPEDAARFTIA